MVWPSCPAQAVDLSVVTLSSDPLTLQAVQFTQLRAVVAFPLTSEASFCGAAGEIQWRHVGVQTNEHTCGSDARKGRMGGCSSRMVIEVQKVPDQEGC
jgi:hypothetical protein